VSDAADVFVIASGTSDTHVRALAERVLEAVERAGGHAHHAEGVRAGRWALLDFVNVVVHVFHPTLRDYYQLERLWVDAPVISPAGLGDGPQDSSASGAGRASRRTG
jgi:ribosome-associated protein